MTTERGALFDKKSILFGIFAKWRLWSRSCCGYLFLHENAEHLKNTVLYWKDAHKKVNCSLAIPFLGYVRGTKRGDLSVKNKKPWSSGIHHETPHFIGAGFASFDLVLLSISSTSKDPQREKQTIRKAAMDTQAGPSASKLSITMFPEMQPRHSEPDILLPQLLSLLKKIKK